MTIYGVAFLAFCFLVGKILGNLLGDVLGFNGDIGGVGFAMIILILGHSYLQRNDMIEAPSTKGIMFWSNMYIPVIIAMAATQNVHAALSGGWVALLAGLTATAAGFYLVPVLSKIGRAPTNPNA
ncbi:MAG: malonate transporter subunit MadL [Saprospiraceae bacterium]|nr:malonate transporter subunit MadL [Saprospiraceae bacterium]|tara:strand:- start:236 stop:610 length:375 start_codon:yes stop_codon:yes gene_type:complete